MASSTITMRGHAVVGLGHRGGDELRAVDSAYQAGLGRGVGQRGVRAAEG
jgi:hypothetical protein